MEITPQLTGQVVTLVLWRLARGKQNETVATSILEIVEIAKAIGYPASELLIKIGINKVIKSSWAEIVRSEFDGTRHFKTNHLTLKNAKLAAQALDAVLLPEPIKSERPPVLPAPPTPATPTQPASLVDAVVAAKIFDPLPLIQTDKSRTAALASDLMELLASAETAEKLATELAAERVTVGKLCSSLQALEARAIDATDDSITRAIVLLSDVASIRGAFGAFLSEQTGHSIEEFSNVSAALRDLKFKQNNR